MTDLDAVVGTKIYDLSPFFAEVGPRGAVRCGAPAGVAWRDADELLG
ncbi:hypothetical protein SLNWT_7143 [Streptomyces albus]|uniref:Uncharacterized protein n=1 Tax=Streptomyces albus (strain ATCC 21838 / DSM 41398 / FERM P-419 / JCM 4703 / NBRC 107858) TaxID=1081613 RepID=A0A0B5F0B6_STRA4|nr:hypothetical protein SLNWT_7143 [Streptomyces albus]AOU81823.1 hypothetical protein SLNHY_7132 [Streptomyces albus]AYN37510.1 hypothetical protein DUI70_7017 [Streptomyces albus]